MPDQKKAKRLLILAPLFGICIFITLYLVAASLYPGGYRGNPTASGFSLLHNYWCDLFDVITYNGSVNPSRPIAIAAMFVVCMSLGGLFSLLPGLFKDKSIRQTIIRITGVGSMVIAFFIFTSWHEVVINLCGLFGGTALVLTLAELYRSRLWMLFYAGVTCVTLSCLNFFIYKTGIWLPLLASIQKFTFFVYYGWSGMLNWAIYLKHSKSPAY
jgi:hypothetical protein